jgi:FkbM family methyltransferase
MRYDVIEIGTCDFDVEAYKATDDQRVLSIEPLPCYYDRLPDKPNIHKLCCAVSDKPGTATLHYIPEDTIYKHRIRMTKKGCSCLHEPHKGTVEELQAKGLPLDLMETTEVPVKTFEQIVEQQDITSIGYLKIDTEGHDIIIMRSVVDLCRKRRALFPSKIQFECNSMVDKGEVNAMVKTLEAEGYKLLSRGRENLVLGLPRAKKLENEAS